MAGSTTDQKVEAENGGDTETRRDFLLISTVSVGAVGAAIAAWPFIDLMNPSADVLALASTEVDLSSIEEGQSITTIWRGKPVFIRKRTSEEIEAASNVEMMDLKDPGARCRQSAKTRMACNDWDLHPSRLHTTWTKNRPNQRRIQWLVLPLPRFSL